MGRELSRQGSRWTERSCHPGSEGRIDLTGSATRGTARERILDTAERLFYNDGIRTTSVDAIADEAGVTKRTVYHHFASKDELVAAYLERRDPATLARFRGAVERKEATPRETILRLFDVLAAWADSGDYRGCAFLNAVAQCPQDGAVRAAAIAHKDAVEAWFRLQLAGAPDSEQTASMLVVLYDGALARALVYRNGTSVLHARTAAARLLG